MADDKTVWIILTIVFGWKIADEKKKELCNIDDFSVGLTSCPSVKDNLKIRPLKRKEKMFRRSSEEIDDQKVPLFHADEIFKKS